MVAATQQVQRKADGTCDGGCARWRSAAIRWKKKEEVARENRGCGSLCGTWLGAVDDDGVRFIVPLGMLHLSLLAAKLAVYATPTSDWHASACACMLLSIIPDSDFTRHCYRVIFWKFVRGFCLEWNLSAEFMRRIRKEWVEGCSYRCFRILLLYFVFQDHINFIKKKESFN